MTKPVQLPELLELDFELLRDLPPVGSKVGLQPLGSTVATIKRQEKFEGISSDQLAARLRMLKQSGLAQDVTVLPISAGRGWQRTSAGLQALKEFDSKAAGS